MSNVEMTRFAVMEAERVVKIHIRKLPELKADEVLIKNGACNICTTDYGQWTEERTFFSRWRGGMNLPAPSWIWERK